MSFRWSTNDWSNLGSHTYECLDLDADNICDKEDDCVGEYDCNGVCNDEVYVMMLMIVEYVVVMVHGV